MELQETLNILGITKEELHKRVIDQICDQLLMGRFSEGDGEDGENTMTTRLSEQLHVAIRDQINKKISDIAEKHILPNISNYVENLTLKETNAWGEQKGKTYTFIEYLIQRAEAYMTEKVDYDGKGKGETYSSSWTGTQTRITHMVHKHLHYSIETAMKSALQQANSAIVSGLEATVRIKMEEISKALKLKVETR